MSDTHIAKNNIERKKEFLKIKRDDIKFLAKNTVPFNYKFSVRPRDMRKGKSFPADNEFAARGCR